MIQYSDMKYFLGPTFNRQTSYFTIIMIAYYIFADEQWRSSAPGPGGRGACAEDRQWRHQHGLRRGRPGAARPAVPQTSDAPQTAAGNMTACMTALTA